MAAFKPMLAGAVDFKKQKYPCLVSPKLDGIRVLGVGGKAMTRSMKEVPNKYVQSIFSSGEFDGLDGEIIVGSPTAPDVYRVTNSAIMSVDGEPDFTYWVFDKWGGPMPYLERLRGSQKLTGSFVNLSSSGPPFSVEAVPHLQVNDESHLLETEKYFLEQGYEGVMVRDPNAPYKNGRSTTNEGYLLKLKRFIDAEYEVIGFEERMHNGNEATTDALGHTKRSSHAENKVGRNDLGALVLRQGASEFRCGTGFTDEMRTEIWANRGSYMGKLAKVKSFQIGVKDLPRFPVFLGWRAQEDL